MTFFLHFCIELPVSNFVAVINNMTAFTAAEQIMRVLSSWSSPRLPSSPMKVVTLRAISSSVGVVLAFFIDKSAPISR